MTAVVSTDEKDKALSAVARGGSLNLVGSVCTAIMTFALAIVLTRGLGAEGAGPYFVAIPIFHILVRCSELGVSTGLIRWVSQARVLDRTSEIRPIVWMSAFASFAAGVVLMAIGLLSVDRLVDLVTLSESSAERVAAILPVFLLTLPVATAYFALVNGSRGFGTMKPSAVLDRMVRPTAQLVLVAGAVVADLSSELIALAWALPYVVLAAVSAIWVSRLTTRAAKSNPASSVARPMALITREFWSFTLPRAVAAVFQGTSLWLNPIMVSALAGTAAAAIYTAGYRYLQLGTFLALAVGQSVQPLISQAIARTAISDAQHLFETTSSWLTLFVTPLYMAVAAFAVPLLSLFGPEFAEAQWALVALSVAAMFSAVCGPVDTVLLMGGRSVLSTYNMALGLAVNVGLNLALIPTMGITGAGIAFGAGMIVINLAPLIQVKKYLSLSPFGAGTRIAGLLALVVFLPPLMVGRIIGGDSLIAAIIVPACAAVVYAPFVWRFREQLRLDQFASIVGRTPKKAPPTEPPTGTGEGAGTVAVRRPAPPVRTSPMIRIATPIAAATLVVACSGTADDVVSSPSTTAVVATPPTSSFNSPSSTATTPTTASTALSGTTAAIVTTTSIGSTTVATEPAAETAADETATPEPAPEPDARPSAEQLDEGARLACANAELAELALREATPDAADERVDLAAEWAADSRFEEFQAFSVSLTASTSDEELEISLENVLTTCKERGYEPF